MPFCAPYVEDMEMNPQSQPVLGSHIGVTVGHQPLGVDIPDPALEPHSIKG